MAHARRLMPWSMCRGWWDSPKRWSVSLRHAFLQARVSVRVPASSIHASAVGRSFASYRRRASMARFSSTPKNGPCGKGRMTFPGRRTVSVT